MPNPTKEPTRRNDSQARGGSVLPWCEAQGEAGTQRTRSARVGGNPFTNYHSHASRRRVVEGGRNSVNSAGGSGVCPCAVRTSESDRFLQGSLRHTFTFE